MTAGAGFRLAEGGRVRFTLGEAPTAVVAGLRRPCEEVAVILAGRELAQPGGHDAAEGAALALHHAAPADPKAWRPATPMRCATACWIGLRTIRRRGPMQDAHHRRARGAFAVSAPTLRSSVAAGSKRAARWSEPPTRRPPDEPWTVTEART